MTDSKTLGLRVQRFRQQLQPEEERPSKAHPHHVISFAQQGYIQHKKATDEPHN
jgi:hypothetical protein